MSAISVIKLQELELQRQLIAEMEHATERGNSGKRKFDAKDPVNAIKRQKTDDDSDADAIDSDVYDKDDGDKCDQSGSQADDQSKFYSSDQEDSDDRSEWGSLSGDPDEEVGEGEEVDWDSEEVGGTSEEEDDECEGFEEANEEASEVDEETSEVDEEASEVDEEASEASEEAMSDFASAPEAEEAEDDMDDMELTIDEHRSKLGQLEEEHQVLKDKQLEFLLMLERATSALSELEKSLAKEEKAKNAYCSKKRSEVSALTTPNLHFESRLSSTLAGS